MMKLRRKITCRFSCYFCMSIHDYATRGWNGVSFWFFLKFDFFSLPRKVTRHGWVFVCLWTRGNFSWLFVVFVERNECHRHKHKHRHRHRKVKTKQNKNKVELLKKKKRRLISECVGKTGATFYFETHNCKKVNWRGQKREWGKEENRGKRERGKRKKKKKKLSVFPVDAL